MSNLILFNVSKTYNLEGVKLNILKNVNLNLKENESIAIMGKSGCGKSTLLNIICGFEKIDGGEIKNSFSISYVHQNPSFIPELNLFENILLGCAINKKDYNKAIQEINYLCEIFGLCHKNKNINQLSGGEKVRLSFIRSLILNPQLLVLDEPTHALDQENANFCMEKLIQLQKSNHFSFILVTHDKIIAQYANKQFKLMNGELF